MRWMPEEVEEVGDNDSLEDWSLVAEMKGREEEAAQNLTKSQDQEVVYRKKLQKKNKLSDTKYKLYRPGHRLLDSPSAVIMIIE
jgi:hypothetical protein